jgi:protein-S-isoprenylcysteine O-methyltransferase Ste14
MNHDQTVRLVLILAFAIIIPIGIYHRVKSQSTHEKLDRRQEGVFILATLRPIAVAFWFATLAWTINPAWLRWSSLPLPVWLRWVGVSLLVCGVILMVWTFRSLGPNLTDTVVTRKNHTLVLYGPYQWVRHPFYLSGGLLSMAISLIAANWFLLVSGVALLCLLVIRTRTEEANLVARFGDVYRTYMEHTGRFVPRRRPNRSEPL